MYRVLHCLYNESYIQTIELLVGPSTPKQKREKRVSDMTVPHSRDVGDEVISSIFEDATFFLKMFIKTQP
jgi:hypothetical protein